MIQRKIKLRPGELRRGWMVKAAAWVKKRHVDRGDRKVGVLTGPRQFQVIKVSEDHVLSLPVAFAHKYNTTGVATSIYCA